MSYENRKDIQKWLNLSEENDYTPEILKEEFSGVGNTEKVMKVIKMALKNRGTVNIRLKKIDDENITYKIDQR